MQEFTATGANAAKEEWRGKSGASHRSKAFAAAVVPRGHSSIWAATPWWKWHIETRESGYCERPLRAS